MKILGCFKDPLQHTIFEKQGYVRIPALNEKQIQEILQFFNDLDQDENFSFYTSIWSNNPEHRKQVNDFLVGKLFPVAQQFLNEIKPVFSNFMVKKPGADSSLGYHQDWTFSDQEHWPAINIWIPLQDVSKENGTLRLIPGSHRLNVPVRGRNIPSPLEQLDKKWLEQHAISLEVKAGEAVCFHEKLIHGSGPNYSDQTRPAVSLVVMPQQADLIHYAQSGDQIVKLHIQADFFVNFGLFDALDPSNFLHDYTSFEVRHFPVKFLYNRFMWRLNAWI